LVFQLISLLLLSIYGVLIIHARVASKTWDQTLYKYPERLWAKFNLKKEIE